MTQPAEKNSKQPQIELVTFGCRLNAYESEIMRAHAESAGLDNLVIINSCAVTSEATRQARQTIRKLKRENPERAILVTGCAAQINPDEFRQMPEVAGVIGNSEKLQKKSFLSLAEQGFAAAEVNDIFSVKETAGHLIDGFSERARAFVQIQNGCNHRCTFCIIPYGRGNSRSIAMGQVIEQIKRLVASGFKEVVLTGVDITSYGEDLPSNPKLGDLVQKILKLVPDLPRLRLSSIDSIEIDPPLMDAIIGSERLMPHLHLSLQAGDNMILKRMKRRHAREQAIDFCTHVRQRRPEIVFGADLIAGFPTEDEAMFAQSLDLVDACDLSFLHVFPYSERSGTPAARMPQIAKAIRKERAQRLRAKGLEKQTALFKRRLNGQAMLLVERIGEDGSAFGHSEDFIPLKLSLADTSKEPEKTIEGAGPLKPGMLLPVRLIGLDGDIMQAGPLL